MPKEPTPRLNGLLVIDKPAGLTSRAALDRAGCWFPRGAKLGHAGTLDPLATGVLVICIGTATRLVEYVQRMEKVYRAGIRLGARSDTDDADGRITTEPQAQPPAPDAVSAALATFLGDIEQTPPAYSAAHVAGRRAYALARAGREVDLTPRRVRIHEIHLVEYVYPRLVVEVRCGKGTYIRSLARDLGERLGCGGYIESLRRTRIGPFSEGDALPLEAAAEVARQSLCPVAAAVHELPQLPLDDASIRRLKQGQEVASPSPAPDAEECAVFATTSELAAVVRVDKVRGVLMPHKVLVH